MNAMMILLRTERTGTSVRTRTIARTVESSSTYKSTFYSCSENNIIN